MLYNGYEAYLVSKGNIIKYIPLPKIGDEYGFKIKKNQPNFYYFNELLSEEGGIHFEVDYLLGFGSSIEDLIKGVNGYIGGTLNLQFKNRTEYNDFVIYEVYIHTLYNKGREPVDILRTIVRTEKINSLLM